MIEVKKFFVKAAIPGAVLLGLLQAGCSGVKQHGDPECNVVGELKSAVKLLKQDHNDQLNRYLGKPDSSKAGVNLVTCRGGDAKETSPWVGWSKYFATGDAKSGHDGRQISGEVSKNAEQGLDFQLRNNLKHLTSSDFRGLTGSLLDLEVQRMELINLNLFDNHTYQNYVEDHGETKGRNLKQWDAMRLEGEQLTAYRKDLHIDQQGKQNCLLPLLRYRNRDGICNDAINPKMGSAGTLFSRNVAFEASFPNIPLDQETRNRHGDRLKSIMSPNPQLISHELFSRDASSAKSNGCNNGYGLPGNSPEANCDYAKAPFFNVLAAFWIQFMTHDWFAHIKEGHNDKSKPRMAVGCTAQMAKETGCRVGSTVEPVFIAESGAAEKFTHDGKEYLSRAYKTTKNLNTAWWDASQIYGFDQVSADRVIRDPQDPAKLLLEDGYLPLIDSCKNNCEVQPHWRGQESAAFADNWSIGLSFYHNVFAREHNSFVTAFRQMQRDQGNADSGVIDLANPGQTKTYAQVSSEEIFQMGRLVVSAEIAKIHTIEWTTQLLYNESLHRGMNSNWYGLINLAGQETDKDIVQKVITGTAGFTAMLANKFGSKTSLDSSNEIYSLLASGAGIFGLNNGMSYNKAGLMRPKQVWGANDLDKFNQGINHFGSPFNFPEEFTSVYRLHPLVPDLAEFRGNSDANQITAKIPLVNTVRGKSTPEIHRGLDKWALTMGRQRLGLLQLGNHPQFLQNLEMPHLGAGATLDITALDIIRDRERGVPKFNELRRQIGLKSLTSFDDFINQASNGSQLAHEQALVAKLRRIYGRHRCDNSKVITKAQTNRAIKDRPHYQTAYGTERVDALIDDCLGHANGTEVDNIEDLDLVVGWLAETTRPHGYAISETQFHIFIINASRRLFSDRFFTSSFRPEFYSHLGVDWVNNNGPVNTQVCPQPLLVGRFGNKIACLEPKLDNGHMAEVSAMKRILMRNVPALTEELLPVVNAFDPWARDRGVYYSLDWTPRPGAEADPAFAK